MAKEGAAAFITALVSYMIVPDILDKVETAVFIFAVAFLAFFIITGLTEAYRDMIRHRSRLSMKRSREMHHPEREHPDLITLRKGGTGLYEEQPDGTVLEVPFVTFK